MRSVEVTNLLDLGHHGLPFEPARLVPKLQTLS